MILITWYYHWKKIHYKPCLKELMSVWAIFMAFCHWRTISGIATISFSVTVSSFTCGRKANPLSYRLYRVRCDRALIDPSAKKHGWCWTGENRCRDYELYRWCYKTSWERHVLFQCSIVVQYVIYFLTYLVKPVASNKKFFLKFPKSKISSLTKNQAFRAKYNNEVFHDTFASKGNFRTI